MLITESSPFVETPKNFKIDLFPHQKRVVYSSIQLEKKSKIGVLCDKAGTGKTSILLALTYLTKIKNRHTLVVCPPNIVKQWKEEVKKFSDSLKVIVFISYERISRILFHKKNEDPFDNYDIVITTDLLYENLISNLNAINYTGLSRIIFDEIDTCYNILKNIDYKLKYNEDFKENIENKYEKYFTWFVSASFFNMINEDSGFKFIDQSFSIEELDSFIIKTDEDYIKKSIFQNKPYNTNLVKSSSLIDKFHNYMSLEQIESLNSIDYNKITTEKDKKIAKTEVESVKYIIENFYVSYLRNLQRVDDIEKKIEEEEDLLEEEIKVSYDILDKSKKSMTKYKTMLCKIHQSICKSKRCGDSIEKACECIYKVIEDYKDSLNKESKVKETISKVINENKNPLKILFFSHNKGVYPFIEEYLTELKENFYILSGDITKDKDIVKEYTSSSERTWLIVGDIASVVGLNLQNTDVLFLLHRIGESMYNQVIGRAQRGIRTCPLEVYYFLNENEII